VINKVAYRGLTYKPSFASSTTDVCPQVAAPPDFTLFMTAPPELLTSDASVRYPATAGLTTKKNGSPDGAQGWSIGVRAAGGKIVDATVSGTAGADVTAGGLRTGGFEKTELTVGPGNEGAVSSVVLSFDHPVTLEANGTAEILKLSVE